MKKNLYLIFPYRGTGGVSILFKRAAEWLADKDYSIKVIDYSDGFLSKNVDNENIEIISYEDSLIEILDNSICLMQLMTPWSIFKNINFKSDTKFFFWNCHPNNLIPSIPIFSNYFEQNLVFKKNFINSFLSKYQKNSKTFLELLLKNRSVAFMDDVNIKNTEFFLDINLKNVQKLPIPVILDKKSINKNHDFKKTLRVTWVGRIEDFKTKSLEKVIGDLENINQSLGTHIIFNLIGQGKDLNQIKNKTSLSSLDYRFFDYLEISQLKKFLKEETDLLFAMGTSALEGGNCSVPTIVLDISHTKLTSNYNYKWLYEIDGYNLAEVVHKRFLGTGTHKIENVINEIFSNKDHIGELCKNYVKMNHDSESIFKNLELFLNDSSLRWDELVSSKVLESNLIYKIYKYLLG